MSEFEGYDTSTKEEKQMLEMCRKECRKRVKEAIDLNADSLDTQKGRLSFEEQIYGIVLQMIRYIETSNRKVRMEQQKKGIQEAKDAGTHFGREFKFDPLEYLDVCKDIEEGIISVKEAQQLIGASDTTIFRMRKRLRAEGLL